MGHGPCFARGVRLSSAFCAVAVLGTPAFPQEVPRPAGADEPRLLQRLSAPLLHVHRRVEARPTAPADASPAAGVLRNLWTALPIPAGAELAAGVLSRLTANAEEIEFAVTSLLPRQAAPSLPLLVLQARLEEPAAQAIAQALSGADLARPTRKAGGRQVYELLGAQPDAPGQRMEVVLVERDLIVSNQGTSLDEALALGTTAGRPLVADERYRTLRRRIGNFERSAVTVYADWARLGPALTTRLPKDLAPLVDWSGLVGVQRLLLGVVPTKDGLRTTLLVDHGPAGPPAQAGGRAPRAHPDGWLALLEPARASALIAGLPRGGLGAIGFAFAPDRLASVSAEPGSRFGALRHGIEHGCDDSDLDFERHVLRRLANTAGVQFLGDMQNFDAVLALRTSDKSAAQAILGDLRRALVHHGQALPLQGRRTDEPIGRDQLILRGSAVTGMGPVHVATLEDSVLLTLGARSLIRLADELRNPAALRTSQVPMAALWQRYGLPKQPVAGVIALDLSRLARAASPQSGSEAAPAGFSFGRHVGCFWLDDGVLRADLLSQL